MPHPWTLLITDDCAEDREMYREYLSSDPHQSYQILEAASAEVGLELWQNKHCDAILLDFCLPDMSGLEFLDELKQQGLEAPFPVILLTGQGNENIAVQAMKRGAQDYLVKQHLEPDILQSSVRTVIQQSQQQAEQLAQAIAALDDEKRLNAFKSHFVSTVSYEYRSPLATILAAASTLKQQGKTLDQSKRERFLQLIEDKARQMTQQVEDLLVLEIFESDQAAFTPLPFEVLQFVSDIIEEQRPTLHETMELSFKIIGNTRGFWGDQKLLRQILVNLLTNAIKYSPDGSMVEVCLRGSYSHILLDVSDRGIGIPVHDQPEVFDLFRRGSNVESIPGMGVGLAIVKACVDLHKGEIAIKSHPGQGTTVTVSLPKQIEKR